LIEAAGLSKRYRDVVAIDDVSFAVEPGAIVGLLGPNGAGKSTTLRILAGALPPSSGRARVAGHDVHEEPMQVKRRVGYMPEHPPLYPDLTVEEYLRFIGVLKGLRGGAEVDRVIGRTHLGEVRQRLLRNCSKGFQQRAGLAQALLGNPPVLILDEPTAGLDPRQIGEVRALVKELAGEHTVLLSTHILQEVTAICSRVVIVNRGRVVADAALDVLVREHGGASLEDVFLRLTEL
jgi:ABC-2 type transport system ATP-binding protein